MKKTKSTITEIREYVNYWKKLLNLNNWQIFSEVTYDKETYASIRIHSTSTSAYIKIQDPSDIPEEWSGVRDLEVTVVHELMHLRWHFAENKSEDKVINDLIEQAVESTSIAMVAARRKCNLKDIK